MTDLETVIKGWEAVLSRDPLDASYDLIDETLTLLKEQEPIKVERRVEETEWSVCGNCGKHIISKWQYCPYCGKKMWWYE